MEEKRRNAPKKRGEPDRLKNFGKLLFFAFRAPFFVVKSLLPEFRYVLCFSEGMKKGVTHKKRGANCKIKLREAKCCDEMIPNELTCASLTKRGCHDHFQFLSPFTINEFRQNMNIKKCLISLTFWQNSDNQKRA